MQRTIESIQAEIVEIQNILIGEHQFCEEELEEQFSRVEKLQNLMKAAQFLESVESRYNSRQEEFNDYLDEQNPEVFIKTCEQTGTMRYLASHILFRTDEVAYWEAFNEFYNDRVGEAYDLLNE